MCKGFSGRIGALSDSDRAAWVDRLGVEYREELLVLEGQEACDDLDGARACTEVAEVAFGGRYRHIEIAEGISDPASFARIALDIAFATAVKVPLARA